MRTCTYVFFVLALGFLVSCSSNPHYDPEKSHHTKTGFKNLYYEDNKGFWAFMKWKWQQLFMDIPDAEDYHFPVDTSRHQWLQTNTQQFSLTWIGHATFLIQIEGLNIVTDPQFSQRASPFSWAGPKRAVAALPALKDLPEIDAVVISHDHYDSLDLDSVTQLAQHNRTRRLTFIVPLGLKAWFEELELDSIKVVELDWGETHRVNNVSFTAEPSQHWGKRSLTDAFQRLWASWVIEAPGQQGEPGKSIFFAGDTGYAEHFKVIGEKYGGFDLALLPIGAYEPRWFMKPYHVDPEESVKIHKDIKSRYSVAMHWGTFVLTDESLDEPPGKLAEALNESNIDPGEFEVFQHGETKVF